MSDGADLVQGVRGQENKLYRAGRWALLGAVCGAFGGVTLYVAHSLVHSLQHDALLASGLWYGLGIGGALWRREQIGLLRLVAFLVLSGCAWFVVFVINVKYFGLFADPAARGFVSGLVWSALLSAGFAVLFPFARRPMLWGILLATGAVSGSALLVVHSWTPIHSDPWFFGIIWSSWYAVYTAILSTALPDRRESGMGSGT